MKKLIIFLIIIVAVVLISYVAHENGVTPISNNNILNVNKTNSVGEQDNNTSKNEMNNLNTENDKKKDEEEKEFIGKEEQESQSNQEKIENKDDGKTESEELTGEERAVDIVTKKYALSGETVRFDHMEAGSYIIKINNGTAVTWYIVDGQTWEAEEY